jgi:hypothetical protein
MPVRHQMQATCCKDFQKLCKAPPVAPSRPGAACRTPTSRRRRRPTPRPGAFGALLPAPACQALAFPDRHGRNGSVTVLTDPSVPSARRVREDGRTLIWRLTAVRASAGDLYAIPRLLSTCLRSASAAVVARRLDSSRSASAAPRLAAKAPGPADGAASLRRATRRGCDASALGQVRLSWETTGTATELSRRSHHAAHATAALAGYQSSCGRKLPSCWVITICWRGPGDS